MRTGIVCSLVVSLVDSMKTLIVGGEGNCNIVFENITRAPYPAQDRVFVVFVELASSCEEDIDQQLRPPASFPGKAEGG